MRQKLIILSGLTLLCGALLFMFPPEFAPDATTAEIAKPFIQYGVFLFAVFAMMFIRAPD